LPSLYTLLCALVTSSSSRGSLSLSCRGDERSCPLVFETSAGLREERQLSIFVLLVGLSLHYGTYAFLSSNVIHRCCLQPPRDAAKPIDLLSRAAPLHAFPTKNPPTVAYSPFSDAFHFPPPTRRRTPRSTVQQHKAAVDVDQLAKDFLQKLHIGGSELANKRPSTQLPTWYPLLTVPSPAPHPALVKPITSPPPRQNSCPGTARSRLCTVSRLPHRQPVLLEVALPTAVLHPHPCVVGGFR
jgi:hypothetical protein